jgi:hypothetical protein
MVINSPLNLQNHLKDRTQDYLILVFTDASSKHEPRSTDWMRFDSSRFRTVPLNDTHASRYYRIMKVLETLAAAFFRTFGITEPSERGRRRAAQFIFALFILIILSFIAAAAILFHMV